MWAYVCVNVCVSLLTEPDLPIDGCVCVCVCVRVLFFLKLMESGPSTPIDGSGVCALVCECVCVAVDYLNAFEVDGERARLCHSGAKLARCRQLRTRHVDQHALAAGRLSRNDHWAMCVNARAVQRGLAVAPRSLLTLCSTQTRRPSSAAQTAPADAAVQWASAPTPTPTTIVHTCGVSLSFFLSLSLSLSKQS
jgi:hypothetical protein